MSSTRADQLAQQVIEKRIAELDTIDKSILDGSHYLMRLVQTRLDAWKKGKLDAEIAAQENQHDVHAFNAVITKLRADGFYVTVSREKRPVTTSHRNEDYTTNEEFIVIRFCKELPVHPQQDRVNQSFELIA